MELQPGQTRQVTITLPASAFSYYNSGTNSWTEARKRAGFGRPARVVLVRSGHTMTVNFPDTCI